MNTLAHEQSLLVQALLAHPAGARRRQADEALMPLLHAGAERGLMAYRAHGHHLAEQALAAAYPVVTQLIGTEAMQSVARALWHAHPPQAGDIGQWGDALPAWLAEGEAWRSVPYLPDVARVEWAMHRAADAADATTDWPSLALLQGDDADTLRLHCSAGTAVFASPWPVADLILHHLTGQPPLEQLVTALHRPGQPTLRHARVAREGWRTTVTTIGAAEAAFTTALLRGRPLGMALTAAAEADAAPFPLADWLLHAVQTGRITGVTP